MFLNTYNIPILNYLDSKHFLSQSILTPMCICHYYVGYHLHYYSTLEFLTVTGQHTLPTAVSRCCCAVNW